MKVADSEVSPKKNPHSCLPQSKCFKIILIVTIALFICFLIIIIVILSLLATVPCTVIQCHSKASKCINHWFSVQCICDYGYQGDGFYYCDECGLSSQSKNVKIIGGSEAVQHSWPSAVYLRFNYYGTVTLLLNNGTIASIPVQTGALCGGSLIDRKHVLTAAHCVRGGLTVKVGNKNYETLAITNEKYPTLESMYTVYLGVHNKDTITSSHAYSIKKIYTHESYDTKTIFNDIAILKLKKEATLSNEIHIACMPNNSVPNFPIETNLKSWAIGWGYTNQTSLTLPSTLQNVEQVIYDPGVCSQLEPETPKNWTSQICAGYLPGGKSACNGDSGNSLFIKEAINGKIKYLGVGIVSYGNGTCGVADNPQIYTRISAFTDWIHSKKHLN